jgi:hypothetical protein
MLCIWRVCTRLFTFDQHLSETGCLDGVNWPLIKYIWNFNRDKKQGIEELYKRYPTVEFLVFHRSQDLDEYLEKSKGNHCHES